MLHPEFQTCLADLIVKLSQDLQNGEVLRGNLGVSRNISMLLLSFRHLTDRRYTV